MRGRLAALAAVPGLLLASILVLPVTGASAAPAGVSGAAVTRSAAAPPAPWIRPAAHRQMAARYYTVRAGNTLSGIAVALCGHAIDWTGMFHVNQATIGPDPDLILPGQRLRVACFDPPVRRTAAVAHHRAAHHARHASSGGKVWGKTYGYPYKCGDGDGDGWDRPCSAAHSAVPGTARHAYRSHRSYASSSYHGAPGSYEACVIAHESGGNSRAVNPSSGAGGTYQFLPSTWRSLGYSGLPQDASPSVQRQAFLRLYAQAGRSPWSSDGC